MQRTFQRKYPKNLAVTAYSKKIKELEGKKKLLEINDRGNRESSVKNEALKLRKSSEQNKKNPKQLDSMWGKVFLIAKNSRMDKDSKSRDSKRSPDIFLQKFL